MYIEFTGCTGSGKSTASDSTIRRLGAGGKVLSVHADHFTVLGPRFERVRHPTVQNLLLDARGLEYYLRSAECRAFMRLAEDLFRRHTDFFPRRLNQRRAVLRKFVVHAIMTAKRDAAQFRVVDEGIVHSAHNLLVHAGGVPGDEEIALFAERVPLPDVLVWVRAPVEVILDRTMRRPDRPLRSDEARLREFVEHACFVFERVMTSARLAARTICVNFDSDRPGLAGELADDIIGQLDTCRRAVKQNPTTIATQQGERGLKSQNA